MAYTILEIAQTLNGPLVNVKHCPTPVTNQGTYAPFQLVDPDWTLPSAVASYGMSLLKSLSSAHQGVLEAIQRIRTSTSVQNEHVLYFEYGGTVADQQYWETLRDTGFLALEPNIQIGRKPSDSIGGTSSSWTTFTEPIVVLAYLSALDRKAITEWENLRDASKYASNKGVSVKLMVRVGEPDLLQSIQQEIASNKLINVSVSAIPPNVVDFEHDVRDSKPHVVHFFCHGHTDGGQKRIQLATVANWIEHLNGAVVSRPLVLDYTNIRSNSLWLVTLNCCEGAFAAQGMHSYAYDLVARQQIPAVIGMLENANQTDAHTLSKHFYPRFIDAIQGIKGSAASKLQICWPLLMADTRRVLGAVTPDSDRRWAVPVIYVNAPHFELQKSNLSQEDVEKVALVATILRGLDSSTPAELRQKIIDETLAHIPIELRPSPTGNLP